MTEGIRIYVEGGGDSKDGRAAIRRGFGAFLSSLHDKARESGTRWNVVASGSRNSCFDDFCTALKTHPEAFNILLVDAEGPVSTGPRQHLVKRDGWNIEPSEEEHCHLMAQTMEAWLVADRNVLKRYYGGGFLDSAIPSVTNVEQIDKSTLESALENATRNTQKGYYHKIRHGADLLKLIDPVVVRPKAKHCDRLFQTLDGLL